MFTTSFINLRYTVVYYVTATIALSCTESTLHENKVVKSSHVTNEFGGYACRNLSRLTADALPFCVAGVKGLSHHIKARAAGCSWEALFASSVFKMISCSLVVRNIAKTI